MTAIALPAAELLCTHPWVRDARAGVASEVRYGVLVALNSDGVRALRERGRQGLIDHLIDHLAKHDGDPPTLWRLAEALPEGSVDDVLRCERTTAPHVLSEAWVDDSWMLELSVPVDLQHFSGHFPAAPVLPGVIQVAWALALAAPRLHTPLHCRSIEALKFQRFLRPGDHARLSLRINSASGKLHFAYRHGEQAYSSGRLVWGASA